MNQLEAIRNQAKRYAQQGLKLRGSPLTALICIPARTGASTLAHLSLAAFCAKRRGEAIEGWVKARTLVHMTHHWAIRGTTVNMSDDMQRKALLLGSLTNLYTINTDHYSNDSAIDTARAMLLDGIRSRAPTQSEVNKIIKEFIKLCRSNITDMPSIRAFSLYNFPIELIMDENNVIRDWLRTINPNSNQCPALPDNFPDIDNIPASAEGFANIWTTLPESALIAYFNLSVLAQPRLAECIQISALFTSAATLSKNSFTQQWVNTRLARLINEMPDYAFSDYISNEVLAAYTLTFSKNHEKSKFMIANMIFNYTIAQMSNLPSISWILEQSRAPNVAALLGLAEGVIKHPVLSYKTLSHVFPKSQLDAVVTLCAYLIHNPYLSLVTPPVTMAAYADLAYVGTGIAFYESSTGGKAKYMATPEASAMKPKDFLDGFIAQIRELSRQGAREALGISSILGSYGLRIEMKDTTTFKIYSSTQTETDDETLATSVQKLDLTREYRPAEIEAVIQQLYTDKDIAFKELLSLTRKAATQENLTLFPDTGTLEPLTCQALTEDVKKLITTLEVAIPAACLVNEIISIVEETPIYLLPDTFPTLTNRHMPPPANGNAGGYQGGPPPAQQPINLGQPENNQIIEQPRDAAGNEGVAEGVLLYLLTF